MFMYAYHNTERGIRERNSAIIKEETRERLQRQRALYEAHLAELARLAEVKRLAAERAADESAARRAMGLQPHKSFHAIELKAMRVFGVTRSALHSTRRFRKIVLARQFVAYWAVRLTSLSLPQIGRLMGKDHTTIIHGSDIYPRKREKMGRYLRPIR